MKINEIIIREVTPGKGQTSEPETSSPEAEKEKNAPRPSSSKSWTKGYTPADLAKMQFTYRHDKQFVNFVQYALLLPHIDTMPQAIAYANTELAARRAKKAGAGLPEPSKPDALRPGQGMSGLGGKYANKGLGGIERGQIGKGFGSGGTVPGLDAVKKAGAKVVNWVGDQTIGRLQALAGIPGSYDPEQGHKQVGGDVTSTVDRWTSRGDKVARDIRGER